MLDFVVVAQKIDKVSERRCSNGFFFCEIVCFVFVSSSLIHYVPLFPLVIALFFFISDGRQTEIRLGEKTREKKSPEVLDSFPLLCSRRFSGWIQEKTRETSPPYILLHTPLLSFHILSFTLFFLKSGCFLKVNLFMQTLVCIRFRHNIRNLCN